LEGSGCEWRRPCDSESELANEDEKEEKKRKKKKKKKEEKKKEKERKEKIGYYGYFIVFNYHKELLNLTFYQNSFICITRGARGAEIKKLLHW
jgi:phage head maturation protease